MGSMGSSQQQQYGMDQYGMQQMGANIAMVRYVTGGFATLLFIQTNKPKIKRNNIFDDYNNIIYSG